MKHTHCGGCLHLRMACIEKSRQRKMALQLLEEFQTFIPVWSMPEKAGETYGAMCAAIESSGTPIAIMIYGLLPTLKQRV